ncbi:MAG: flagellar hook-associated protein 1 [Pirellulaceae bacterium]|nr:MAG: flagellar hook-associated protein 1 [Pirellulaceae bacterium]
MSLFTSLQLAKNSLLVAQLGLQVTGNNIANAHTPGYLRQELIQTPAPTQKLGKLLIGLGVQVDRIQQAVDKFLEERLRRANSDLASSQAQEKSYLELEALLGELGEDDISTGLTNFFNAISDVLNQPESVSVRNLVVLQGDALARQIQRLDQRVRELRVGVNERVLGFADKINGLLKDLARLNVQIVAAEGGESRRSDAVGLRDRRQKLLGELSQIIDITVAEQPSGSVTVYAGGDYLVTEGQFRQVKADLDFDRGLSIAKIKLVDTDKELDVSSGELAGLVAARDQVLGGFLDQLNSYASTLIFEFNKVHSGGQGLTGFTQLASDWAVTSSQKPLDQAGLPFTPTSGSFQVLVRDRQSGMVRSTELFVDLSGLDTDTTLQSLAEALDAIEGVSATIDATGRLVLTSESSHLEFAFADDTSGVLAALGLNSFFAGSSATDIAVHSILKADPGKFAASRNGIGEDTENGVLLAGLLESPLGSQQGASLATLYRQLVDGVSQEAAITRSVAEGFRVFQKSLEGQQLATSGVSLDEEAVRMIAYQRVFQMSARFIVSISQILDSLVNL